MPGVKRSSSTMGGGAPTKSRFSGTKKRKMSKPGTNLGRITGKISPGSTTLSKAPGPFQGRKYMTFLYENALTRSAPGVPSTTLNVQLNSVYDFDKTSLATFGNKQPLYYDTLLTASGPYKSYQVISWKTKFTIVNNTAVPITIWLIPPILATNEIDSVAEADNFPGVKKLYLTAATGSRNVGSLTLTGHQNDVYPVEVLTGNSTTASYAGDPGSPIFGGILVATADGTTNVDFYVAVCHEAYTELQNVDALVS